VTLAEHKVILGVRSGGPTSARRDDSENAPRFFSYGAALLGQRAYGRARLAFRQARDLAPHNSEYWIGLGRVYLEEGDLLAARTHFVKAKELAADPSRANAWLAATYRRMGQYELALGILGSLSEQYPRDKDTWSEVGLCLLKSGRYEEAIPPFQHALDVDPDDLSAHFNLMRCYRSMRRLGSARKEEAIYQTLKEDSLPSVITNRYVQDHPDIERESQANHEHLLR